MGLKDFSSIFKIWYKIRVFRATNTYDISQDDDASPTKLRRVSFSIVPYLGIVGGKHVNVIVQSHDKNK